MFPEMLKNLQGLEQALGYEFKNHELITEALTHRSHFHEFGDSPHNERLEFLGDAVLDLCMTEIVMEFSPKSDEGELSKLRSQLVSERTLARAARSLGLGPHIRLGRGEDLSGGRERDSLLADTLEAVIATIYIDGGQSAVHQSCLMMMKVLARGEDQLPAALTRLLARDAKSRLQELCQSLGFGAPTYECTGVTGPDHQVRFEMAIKINGREFFRADGPTKKEATQSAAKQFLELHGTEEKLATILASQGLESNLRLKQKTKIQMVKRT